MRKTVWVAVPAVDQHEASVIAGTLLGAAILTTKSPDVRVWISAEGDGPDLRDLDGQWRARGPRDHAPTRAPARAYEESDAAVDDPPG